MSTPTQWTLSTPSTRKPVYYFVGDAQFYGRRGRAHWYFDPHPIHHMAGHWCVLDGPHVHWWAPTYYRPSRHGNSWVRYDNYYYWNGPFDDWYWWSYRTYHTSHWGIHRSWVTNHYHRHPAYIYINYPNRRPGYSGRHRNYSGHRSTVQARPRRPEGRSGTLGATSVSPTVEEVLALHGAVATAVPPMAAAVDEHPAQKLLPPG